MLLSTFHVNTRRRQALASYLLSRDFPTADWNAAQLRFQLRKLAARIDERAQHHVTANPRKAVEVSDVHSARLAVRAWQYL